MLDFDAEDIDDMDDDAGDEQEPAPVGRWKATSSYDIYMVDTPKDGDGDGTAGDDTSKKQPKHQHHGAALNPAKAKTVIPAREIIIPRTVPKTTPSSRIQHRRREKPALMIDRQTER